MKERQLFEHITSLGEATIPADANTGQAPHCAHKEACSPFILLWRRSCTPQGGMLLVRSLGEATIPADANTGQAPDCAHKRGIRLQAQLRLAHGSLRDPTLTVLGAQGRKNNRRKHWICAKLTKTAGHQMASTIKNLRRKPLILRGKSHRSIGDFMGVNSPILRPILEGPRGQNLYC